MKKLLLKILPIFVLANMTYAQKPIDTHSHMIPKSYRDYLEKHNALLDEDFPIPQWNLEKHIKFMDAAGIQTSILTLPAPQP